MVLPSKAIMLFFYTILIVGSVYSERQLNGSSSVSTIEDVEIEKKSTSAVEKFVNEYQHGRFTYISSGPFDYLPKDAHFGIWVTAKTQETIQSGRALALAFTKAYFAELQSNKDTLRWYECLCEMFPSRYSGTLSLKNIGVRIDFWDENVDRPKAPYLAEITFYQEKFCYYEADPVTQALRLVHGESFEDAMGIFKKNQLQIHRSIEVKSS